MDLKKELRNPAKKVVYPSKGHINLAEVRRNDQLTGRTLLLFAIAMVCILLFAKFGVVDVLAAASASSARVDSAQNQLNQLVQQNSDYLNVEEQYETYMVNSLSEEEVGLVDRGQILTLLQNTVANAADLQSVTIQGNTVVLQFANASLDDVSRVVASLEGQRLVQNVSVSTAQTNRDDAVVSTATITLANETSQGDAEGTQSGEGSAA